MDSWAIPTTAGTYTSCLNTYDASTEANSELAGTIPGPADGGEGFNATRDDVDFVARHSGILLQDILVLSVIKMV